MLDLVAKTTGGPDRSVAAPVLGFVRSSKRVKTSYDPDNRPADPVADPLTDQVPVPSCTVDTGLADDFGLAHDLAGPASVADVDPLEGSLALGFLGRAAGHGTFVQTAWPSGRPGARVRSTGWPGRKGSSTSSPWPSA